MTEASRSRRTTSTPTPTGTARAASASRPRPPRPGTSTTSSDCDDTQATVYPGAVEILDGLDNDCDGAIDEDFGLLTYYVDADSDGYGTSESVQATPPGPPGYATNSLDCDDANASINPGAVEVLGDGIDNDCDGITDEPA